jgi:hypothetical protein
MNIEQFVEQLGTEHQAGLKKALDFPAIESLVVHLVKENVELKNECKTLTNELALRTLRLNKANEIGEWFAEEAEALRVELTATKETLALAETMEPYARQLEAELTATKERLAEVVGLIKRAPTDASEFAFWMDCGARAFLAKQEASQ